MFELLSSVASMFPGMNWKQANSTAGCMLMMKPRVLEIGYPTGLGGQTVGAENGYTPN